MSIEDKTIKLICGIPKVVNSECLSNSMPGRKILLKQLYSRILGSIPKSA